MSSSGQLSSELQAMSQVENALSGLSEDERNRVLRWAAERFGLSAIGAAPRGGATTGQQQGKSSSGATKEYSDLAEFFAAARPSSDVEKALVVGYWFQYQVGNPELEAQMINTELKHLGHQIGNITRAFDNLMARDPQFIVQTKKTGSSKQARKKYKLTAAGKKEVEKMLDREVDE
jgi:hypothetical protein